MQAIPLHWTKTNIQVKTTYIRICRHVISTTIGTEYKATAKPSGAATYKNKNSETETGIITSMGFTTKISPHICK